MTTQTPTPPTGGGTAATRPASPKPVADKDTVVKKSPKLLSLDNLNDDLTKPKNEKTDSNEGENLSMAPMIRVFDQENVSELWQLFAAQIKDTKGGVSALMQVFLPVVADMTITVSMESDMQKTQFLTALTSLRNFLYSHFGIHPDIQVEVVKSQENATRFYTPQDKLKRLIELNPALRRFQKELGLDLDYD